MSTPYLTSLLTVDEIISSTELSDSQKHDLLNREIRFQTNFKSQAIYPYERRAYARKIRRAKDHLMLMRRNAKAKLAAA